MTDWIEPPLAQIDELQAYDAMFMFLEAYWERGGRSSDDIATLLGSLSRETLASGAPLDRAQWHDWRSVIAAILTRNAS